MSFPAIPFEKNFLTTGTTLSRLPPNPPLSLMHRDSSRTKAATYFLLVVEPLPTFSRLDSGIDRGLTSPLLVPTRLFIALFGSLASFYARVIRDRRSPREPLISCLHIVQPIPCAPLSLAILPTLNDSRKGFLFSRSLLGFRLCWSYLFPIFA